MQVSQICKRRLRRFRHAVDAQHIDQPVQITMIVSEAEMSRLFRVLEQEEIALFYTRQAIEFGTAGVHP